MPLLLSVVGLITPWNYPLLMAVWKVAPGLAAGCTLVLKPSEYASCTCQALCDIAAAAGLPAGCLNLITGLGPEAGAPLSAHAGVDKVAFTGSLATGKRIMQAAAANVVPVVLELGGKSPIVVFDDAVAPGDAAGLDRVVEWLMMGCFFGSGQVCSATSRVIVQKGIAKELLARLKHHAELIEQGDPLSPTTRMGALINAVQYQRVTGLLAGAIAEGATVLTGGRRPDALDKGYFIQPTVLTNVTPAMTIWREEVFGPARCPACLDVSFPVDSRCHIFCRLSSSTSFQRRKRQLRSATTANTASAARSCHSTQRDAPGWRTLSRAASAG